MRIICSGCIIALLTLASFSATAVEIVTQHVDNARSGANTAETQLTTGNVAQATFGKLFTVSMNANVNGQALYVPGLTINSGTHNTVFVYTSNNSNGSPCGIYAFDADTGGAALWSRTLTNAAQYATCTPVIDSASKTMYFVSKDNDNNGNNWIHAVDITTGAEKTGSPVVIAGSVPGTGDGTSGGNVTFPATHANCRPGLLLMNGVLYLGFSFNSDARPYHGWVLSYTYNGTAFTRTHIFCVSPNKEAGGIWQAGKGLVGDGTYVYCTTGNGSFDNSLTAGSAFGMCFLRLDNTLQVVDYFAEANESADSNGDADLGNCGPVLIPGTSTLFAGSTKYNKGHLVNAANMGRFSSSADACLQTISVGGSVGSNPIAWAGSTGTFVYLYGGGTLHQYQLASNALTQTHTASAGGGNGGTCVSSNGTANGIVWMIDSSSVVHAYDATNVATELWNSSQNSARDGLPSVGHFQFPMVAAGKLYVPTGNSSLAVYGLLSVQTATKLAVTQQPTDTTAGSTISAVKVTVQDSSGATVVGSSAAVTLAIGTNPAAGTLAGTLTVNAVNGVATFSTLSINNAGTGYTLAASASGLTGATSTAFNILAKVATPTIIPNGGSFTGPTAVRFSDATGGAAIHYTTNGATPTGASATYDPANPPVVSATATVKAIATESGLADSSVASAVFTITGTTAYGLPFRNQVTGLNVGSDPGTAPSTLAGTGVFSALGSPGTPPTPADGIVPYVVNTPLWSDGAVKQRWIALAGTSTVTFHANGEWSFPGGTVFIKHFEIGIDDTNPALTQRLETRILVVNSSGTSGYGITYKWNTAGTAATLETAAGEDQVITIATGGGGTRTQTWHYPSQGECLTCHTTNAGFVLGAKTRQLNGTFTYPSTGVSDNQLRTWNHLQMFSADIGEGNIAGFSRMKAVGDTTATLEDRVKSYLDANCGQCHRPGGVATAWDARYDTAMVDQQIVNGAVKTDLGITGAKVVVPFNVPLSIMHVRMASTDGSGASPVKMPPLARNVVDSAALAVLDAWIGAGASSGGTANTDNGGGSSKKCGLGLNAAALVLLALVLVRRRFR